MCRGKDSTTKVAVESRVGTWQCTKCDTCVHGHVHIMRHAAMHLVDMMRREGREWQGDTWWVSEVGQIGLMI